MRLADGKGALAKPGSLDTGLGTRAGGKALDTDGTAAGTPSFGSNRRPSAGCLPVGWAASETFTQKQPFVAPSVIEADAGFFASSGHRCR